MDLKSFVADTITQIAEGIKLAQERTRDLGAYVSPRMADQEKLAGKHAHAPIAQKIDFDIALEVLEETQKQDGTKHEGGLRVAVVHVGGDSRESTSRTGREATTSRIKFTIPVRWPVVVPEDPDYVAPHFCAKGPDPMPQQRLMRGF